MKAKKKSPHQKNYSEHSFDMLDIIPLTANQRKAFAAFHSGKNLLLHGMAGTGKTYISIYLAMKEVERGKYEKVIVYRSVVPGRDMGFLPGNQREKMAVYEAPYIGILDKLYNRKGVYASLKQQGKLEFESTSFNRGITIDNAIIIVDEIQNLAWQEIFTIITRMGNNCRIVLCGDFRQTDLVKETSGIFKLFRVTDHLPDLQLIEFGVDDVIRGEFVKRFLIACHDHDLIATAY